MDEEFLIPSFQKDHNTLMPGLHQGVTEHGVTTWDLRFKRPNEGNYIKQAALHSIEHMLATLFRASSCGSKIIYFGPMGCRTGFYLLTVDLDRAQVTELTKQCLAGALAMREVPGAKKEECGNYTEHDLAAAKRELAAYLQLLNEM